MFYAASILLINTKFTGIPFYIIIVLGFLLFLVMGRSLKLAVKFGLFASGAGVLAILVFGFDTYVRNYLIQGHPLFPLYGSNPVDIMTGNTPASFLEMNRFQKFFTSIFSATSNSLVSHHVRPPFLIDDLKEIKDSIGHDTRIAGFGFLFSGILIFAAVGLLFCMRSLSAHSRRATLAIVATILAMVFVHPEAWWARYVPQLWIIPVISVICLVAIGGKMKGTIGFFLTVLIFVNSGAIFIGMLLSNYYMTNHIRDELIELKIRTTPIVIDFDQFPSLRYRLKYSDVNFIEVDKDGLKGCIKASELYGSHGQAKYC
jgi:hypothetical protein